MFITTALSSWFVLFSIIFLIRAETKVTHHSFTKTTICNVQERLDNNCTSFAIGVGSDIRCAVLCGLEVHHCIGFHWTTGNKKCFLHKQCPAIDSCTGDYVNDAYLLNTYVGTETATTNASQACQNGGVWNLARGRCDCINGTVGEVCSQRGITCKDLLLDGYETGFFLVYLNLFNSEWNLVRVACFIGVDNNIALTYLMVNKGAYGEFSFNRTWDEYVDGFGDTLKGFWLGLEPFRILTTLGHTKITLGAIFWYNDAYSTFAHTYTDFSVSGISEKYAFKYRSSYSANSGPQYNYKLSKCFDKVKDKRFSTWDVTNNNFESSCAASRGSAWWGKDCDENDCNFLGFVTSNNVEIPEAEKMVLPNLDLHQVGKFLVRTFLSIQEP